MHALFRFSALGAVLVALMALAFRPADAPRGDTSTRALSPTHTIAIEYQQQRGDFRRASLKITPKEPGARAPWRGRLHSVSVLSTDGRWVVLRNLEQSRGGDIQANALLPAPEDVALIILKPMRGPMLSWKVEEGEGYTEVEWTYFNQNGGKIEPFDLHAQDGETPEDPDAPKDPPSDGDDGGGGDDDGGDDDGGCEGAGSCTGIIDPWTCECSEDIRDPWEDEVGSNLIMMSI